MTAVVMIQPGDTKEEMLHWATAKGLSSRKSKGYHEDTEGQGKSTETSKPQVLNVPRKEASQG